jgi:MoxR-like ATPase
MSFLRVAPGTEQRLAASSTVPELVHVFGADEIGAVNAAIAAKRPLLVRGEPGIGKSQLARASAAALGRAFVQVVVDVRTESRDLQWHYDAVARLADAQLLRTLGEKEEFARARLDVLNYLHPQVLWWAFAWEDAASQAERVEQKPPTQPDGGNPRKGCLVLIDEIDKAESDVPNGLLEALGAGSFPVPGRQTAVTAKGEPPLVVITTNEERALPDAFIRRCLVLHLRLPQKRDELVDRLIARARAHFPAEQFPAAQESVLRRAAELLVDDREVAERENWLPLPGQAEYLDLVRAVLALAGNDGAKGGKAKPDAREILDEVARYVLLKHPDAFGRKQASTE